MTSPWINARGERVITLPTIAETLAETEAQLAMPDCPHRDMLLRVRDRLRAALSKSVTP